MRCSYSSYDHVDEVSAAFSLTMNPAADKIYAGYNRRFEIFDITQPGRGSIVIPTAATKRSYGQKGIISCLSVNHEVVVAGSYLGTVGVYSKDGEPISLVQGQPSGITQVALSPDGCRVYAGARRNNQIYCWDLRMIEEGPILSFERNSSTNQRFYFDLSQDGSQLVTSCQEQRLLVYDTHLGQNIQEIKGHSGPVNGCCIHPFLPYLIASSSGERKFKNMDDKEATRTFSSNDVIVWCAQRPI
eukprot:TRINITY_DN3959_c0_g1_i1.p1 TRINITY_DN3959_c0_g1~~TRINITY_DN3959_c0_g1_i1.p1  ORF type:complete len:244 (-),score=27.31 TRINITY_DN3959_c0_g1_i1:73-804(-)